MAHDAIKAGSADVIVAGGMESMTNAPHMLPKLRSGMRLGHGEVLDHMLVDGLECAFEKGRLMGNFAEDCATKYEFTREAQDAYAIESLKRAQSAITKGLFKPEIEAVKYQTRKGEVNVDTDEQPAKAQLDKIPSLRPAFAKDGTVTAANSSSISDGAAAVVLCSETKAKELGVNAVARILAHTSHAQAPGWFTTAPVYAIDKLLTKVGWSVEDVDLFEVNEAFASVVLRFQTHFNVDHDKLNVNGGAIAMGHPLGATGAVILGTLLDEMERSNKETGLATLCIGSGMGAATILERV